MNDSYQLPPISEAFKAKITGVFPNGESWLQKLPLIIRECVDKWQLSFLEVPPALYYNFICFADAAEYGPVVLKIGVPHEDLYVQMDSITYFNNEYVSRLHAADQSLGAVLLERIIPGYDLTSVAQLSQRADIAGELIRNLPVNVSVSSCFPTFHTWLDTAFKRLMVNRRGHTELLDLAAEANTLYSSLPDAPSEQRLIHGDLHHFNIIFDERRNKWKAIDPHGVVGYFALESGRFINNQMGMESSTSEQFYVLQILSVVFAEKLAVTPRAIMTCAFIDTVMSTCWSTEEVAPSEKDISTGIHCANIILSCLRALSVS